VLLRTVAAVLHKEKIAAACLWATGSWQAAT